MPNLRLRMLLRGLMLLAALVITLPAQGTDRAEPLLPLPPALEGFLRASVPNFVFPHESDLPFTLPAAIAGTGETNSTCELPEGFDLNGPRAVPGTVNPVISLAPGVTTSIGQSDRGLGRRPHAVVTITTDLSMDGDRAIVDLDYHAIRKNGKFRWTLAEREIAFARLLADGSVGYVGESPEEIELEDGGRRNRIKTGGKVEARDAWLDGRQHAKGGLIMPGTVAPGEPFLVGHAPTVEFEDCSQIVSVDLRQCLLSTGDCYDNVVVVVEWDPADDLGVAQIKYYANGDVIKVSSLKDPEGEELEQVLARDLMPDELVWARAVAHHLYRTARVKRQALFADAPPLVQDPPHLPPPPPVMP
jgi:hypothetical protein